MLLRRVSGAAFTVVMLPFDTVWMEDGESGLCWLGMVKQDERELVEEALQEIGDRIFALVKLIVLRNEIAQSIVGRGEQTNLRNDHPLVACSE